MKTKEVKLKPFTNTQLVLMIQNLEERVDELEKFIANNIKVTCSNQPQKAYVTVISESDVKTSQDKYGITRSKILDCKSELLLFDDWYSKYKKPLLNDGEVYDELDLEKWYEEYINS